MWGGAGLSVLLGGRASEPSHSPTCQLRAVEVNQIALDLNPVLPSTSVVMGKLFNLFGRVFLFGKESIFF